MKGVDASRCVYLTRSLQDGDQLRSYFPVLSCYQGYRCTGPPGSRHGLIYIMSLKGCIITLLPVNVISVTLFTASLTLLYLFSQHGAHTPPHSEGSHSWKHAWCHERLAHVRPGQSPPECAHDLWQQPLIGRWKSHRSISIKILRGSVQSLTTPKVVVVVKYAFYAPLAKQCLFEQLENNID